MNIVSNKSFFEDNGFTVISGCIDLGDLSEVKDEIIHVGKFIVGSDFDFDRYDSKIVTPEKQSALYDRLRYLPSLSRLAGSKKLLAICSELGMKIPILMGCDNMRYDRPNDSDHLFDWHQDTLYLLGSVNAVTIWIPFGSVDLHHGTIQVIPGSHKNGMLPFKKISDKQIEKNRSFLQRDLALDCTVDDEPLTITASFGDIVVFRQMLLHRSTANNSETVRWTAQIRIADFGSPDYLSQGCPSGDRTNIFFIGIPALGIH